MMEYLGETLVDISTHNEFKHYTATEWALYVIASFGQIDGAHHKDWVLDQITRILNGTPVIVHLATWSNGESEYRITLADPSDKYKKWVDDYCQDGEFGYDIGIAP